MSSAHRAVVAELSGRAAALTLQAVNLEASGYPMESHTSQARRNRRKNHLMGMASKYQDIVRDLLGQEAAAQ